VSHEPIVNSGKVNSVRVTRTEAVELIRRDKAYAEGKIQLTTRKELSLRLKNRRDAL